MISVAEAPSEELSAAVGSPPIGQGSVMQINLHHRIRRRAYRLPIAVAVQLAGLILVVGALFLLPPPARERERVMRVASEPPETVVQEEAPAAVPARPVENPYVANARSLGAFGVRQQLLDWQKEWELARTLQAGLVVRQLDLAQREAAAGAELRTITDLERNCDDERMAWRKVSADIVHGSMRMRLAELQAKLDDLTQKFAKGSVWMRRGEALVSSATRRLEETPAKVEVERVMIADPTREWLRVRKSQVEVQLRGLQAEAQVVAIHLQEVRTKLAGYRRFTAHLQSALGGLGTVLSQ